jgi:hypothetical protein
VTILRIIVGVFTLVYMMPLAVTIFVQQFLRGFEFTQAGLGSVVGTAAVFGWWFALSGHHVESRNRMKVCLAGGLILFIVGSFGGYFLPLVLMPRSNLGPLWGIFLTGPVGFALGTLLGWIYTAIWGTAKRGRS